MCKGDGKGAIGPEGKRGRCRPWKQVGRAEAGSLATRGQRRGRKGSEGLGTGCPAHMPVPLLTGHVTLGQALTGSVPPVPSP